MKSLLFALMFSGLPAVAEPVSNINLETQVYSFNSKEVTIDFENKKIVVPREMVLNPTIKSPGKNKLMLERSKFVAWYYGYLADKSPRKTASK